MTEPRFVSSCFFFFACRLLSFLWQLPWYPDKDRSSSKQSRVSLQSTGILEKYIVIILVCVFFVHNPWICPLTSWLGYTITSWCWLPSLQSHTCLWIIMWSQKRCFVLKMLLFLQIESFIENQSSTESACDIKWTAYLLIKDILYLVFLSPKPFGLSANLDILIKITIQAVNSITAINAHSVCIEIVSAVEQIW